MRAVRYRAIHAKFGISLHYHGETPAQWGSAARLRRRGRLMNEAVLQNALRLRRAGRLAEAAQIYSEILCADPKHFEAMHALGILRYQSGELEQAEHLIAQAVLINPLAAEAHYNRGSLLLKLGRLEEALG